MARRKVVTCMNCGEERQIAAHGLCFRCYRQKERQQKAELLDSPVKHNRQLQLAQETLIKAIAKILGGLNDAKQLLSEDDATLIRKTVQPYLQRIVDGLAPQSIVNNEPEIGELFKPATDGLDDEVGKAG
jgi:hypothetical protein